MPNKRIQLPSTDDLLTGDAPSGSVIQTAPRQDGAKVRKHDSASVPEDGHREHISTYLSTQVLKDLEALRTRFFVDHNRKITKAELIERAIRHGLRNPDELLK